MKIFYLIPLVISLILSLVLTPVVKNLSERLKIVDYPGGRKIHNKPTPLLGGAAIFLAFAITTVILWLLGFIADSKISDLNVLAILAAGLVLIFGGYLDDKNNIKPLKQVIFPIVAIVIVLMSGIKIQFITNPGGGVISFTPYVGTIIAFFWLLGMIYTTKLLDGLDGLVAGVTTIGSLIIFLVSLAWDVPLSGTSILALTLAGASLGFLVFNFHPAKIFLGEGGSVFCGFMLGVLAIISGSKIATALLIMGIPILDVIWVVFKRVLTGRSPVSGDNHHLHFRLLNIGLTHRQAVLFLYLVTGFFGLSSIFLSSSGKVVALIVMAVFMILLAFVLLAVYRIKHDK